LQAKKDATNASRLVSGIPRFAAFSQLTAEELYLQIGERSQSGHLVGVDFIVGVMMRCLGKSTHLFQRCLEGFQEIECRGKEIGQVRGMFNKVEQVRKEWTVAMGYTMETALTKLAIKSLNSKLQGKLFETNFYRTLLSNRNECEKQEKEVRSKRTADNDLILWCSVLDYTLSTFEDQLDFAAGSGVPSKNPSSTRTRNQEKSLNNVAPTGNDQKKRGKPGDKPKPNQRDDPRTKPKSGTSDKRTRHI